MNSLEYILFNFYQRNIKKLILLMLTLSIIYFKLKKMIKNNIKILLKINRCGIIKNIKKYYSNKIDVDETNIKNPENNINQTSHETPKKIIKTDEILSILYERVSNTLMNSTINKICTLLSIPAPFIIIIALLFNLQIKYCLSVFILISVLLATIYYCTPIIMLYFVLLTNKK